MTNDNDVISGGIAPELTETCENKKIWKNPSGSSIQIQKPIQNAKSDENTF